MLESFLYYSIKVVSFLIRLLPVNIAMALGRVIGVLGYWFDVRHKYQVYVNLKIAFAGEKSLAELRQITRRVFENFGQSIIELLRLPLMNRTLFEKYVQFDGREHVDAALAQGKGVILLAMHYGSWEMASLSTAMLDRPYKVIVNPQYRFPKLDQLLNSYRQCGGSVVITKGLGARDFVRSLQNNEIVGLVLDQGGKEGVQASFFGRNASMAVGAIRLGLKMGVPICFSIIHREKGPLHRVTFHAPLEMERTGDLEEDIRRNVQKVANLMELYVRKDPTEYMWFYKIWKYSDQAVIAILKDGRTGHLRQSQAVAKLLTKVLGERAIVPQVKEWDIVFRNRWAARFVSLASILANAAWAQRRLNCLAPFLTPECFRQISSVKADFVISCGSRTAAVNYLLAQEQQAKSTVILKPGLLNFNRFDLVILPQHDCPRSMRPRANVIMTHGAPNLIDPEYLQAQTKEFLKHFSHLQVQDRLTLGLLIGGDTKRVSLSEQKVKMVVHQILEAAEELDAEILATTSRRTPERIEAMLQRELKKSRRCRLLIQARRANEPHAVGGILGLSDIVVVSGDSISMVSEAASAKKKTVVFPLQSVLHYSPERYKHDRFLEMLHTQGFILISEPTHLRQAVYNLAKNKIQQKPLNDTPVICEALREII